MPEPRDWALNRDAEEFVDRAVKPTLLAAAAGLFVGGTTTAGAILRPDYATGVGLAIPLERLREVKLALRNGALIRSGNALSRLATISWVILDDHPALHHVGCAVAEVRTRQPNPDRLLWIAAAAGTWLGDERGSALVRACRDRRLIVRRGDLRSMDAEGVAVGVGDHFVRLRGGPLSAGGVPPPLIVEVDGAEVASVSFLRTQHLEAAGSVRRLQQQGVRVFLVSERAADAAASLAQRLGVDRHCDGISRDGEIELLRELQRQQLRAAYVGDCFAKAAVAREAHLSIGFAAEAGLAPDPSDIALLAPSIASLPAVRALACDSATRKGRARHLIVASNLLCVAGAFAFGFTPMASVIISNLATSRVYNDAKRTLRAATSRGATDWS